MKLQAERNLSATLAWDGFAVADCLYLLLSTPPCSPLKMVVA
jgi:hypothetical protein